MGRARERYPRLLPALANIIIVAPLLLNAAATLRERELPHRSVLTEINSVLGYAGLILLVYVLWLGWDQRRFLLSEVQARNLVPIALVFTDYLLSALEGAPDVIAALLDGVPPDDALWDRRPDPERFSLREIVAHLADWDGVYAATEK